MAGNEAVHRRLGQTGGRGAFPRFLRGPRPGQVAGQPLPLPPKSHLAAIQDWDLGLELGDSDLKLGTGLGTWYLVPTNFLLISACFFLEHERLNHTWDIVYFLVSVNTFSYPAGAGGLENRPNGLGTQARNWALG